MPHLEVVVLRAFRRRRIAADGIHLFLVAEESRHTPRQYLVRIALVAYVEHELVFRCVEHVMQGDGRLYETEVRPYVPAASAYTVQYGLACLVGHGLQGLDVQLFQVGWRLYLLDVHGSCLSSDAKLLFFFLLSAGFDNYL